MKGILLIALLATTACEKSSASTRSTALAHRSAQPSAGDVVTFEGMCDASGAIPLDGGRFAVADDEDNLLRIYDATRGGPPLQVVSLSGLENSSNEMDLEAATRIGDRGLWLASHGRSKRGERKEARVNLFLTSVPAAHAALKLVGAPYGGLLDALTTDPKLESFRLDVAAEIAPNRAGGLNIEGMTARHNGGVVIGFRSPVPDGLALIVGFSNPLAVVEGGGTPHFDAVHRIDLGEGRGIRGLSEWRGRYLLIGGSPTHTSVSQLYTWDGRSRSVSLVRVDLADYNPEGFYTPEDNELILVLSDDGGVDHAGTRCKHLQEQTAKRFRGLWVRLPDDTG